MCNGNQAIEVPAWSSLLAVEHVHPVQSLGPTDLLRYACVVVRSGVEGGAVRLLPITGTNSAAAPTPLAADPTLRE